jgi:hypothetical protein
MAQPGDPIPQAPTRQRPNRRRLWIALAILGGVIYVALQALSGVAAIYLANPTLFQRKAPVAPSGWHNVTPPGQATSYSYAVSVDAPVLILACGASLSTSLTSFGKWSVSLLRSDDGGAHWRALQAPFLKGANDCGITAIAGSQTTFFAYGRRLASSVPTTFWVTHDAGETWKQAFTAQGAYDEYTVMRELSASVLREGVLYGLHGDLYFKPLFSSSADDGATWTPLLPESGAEAPEKSILSLAPDYARAHAWYQLVKTEAGPTAIEHSVDDGKTWTPVADFSRVGATPSALSTFAARPNQLCAYDYEVDSSTSGTGTSSATTMFFSADGGTTWRQAALPLRNGSAHGPARVGANGCYLAFEEEAKGGVFGSSHNVSIWRLSGESSGVEQVLVVKGYRFDYSTETAGFIYVPASADGEARFIISATREPRSWADFFGGNATSLTTPQLLWTPAT